MYGKFYLVDKVLKTGNFLFKASLLGTYYDEYLGRGAI